MADEVVVWIAAYGAIVATGGILWNVYLKYSDRPRIKVSTNPAIVKGDQGLSPMRVTFAAANTGKRPVTLSSCSVEFSDGTMMPFLGPDANLPRRLEEGQMHIIQRSAQQLKQLFKDKKPKSILFIDEAGRRYRSKWWIKLDNLIKVDENASVKNGSV